MRLYGSVSMTSQPVSLDTPARQQPALALYALGLLLLGIVGLSFGDFAMGWQPVAPWFPGRTPLAYVTDALEVAVGIALFIPAARAWAVRILLPGMVLWCLLKVPALVVAPKIEGVWLGFGEIAVLAAGGFVLFARFADLPASSPFHALTTERAIRCCCRYWFALWIIPIGVAHILYQKPTYDLVPAWMPFRNAWVYITGAGQIASGLGILVGVLPSIAAWAEAIQITLYALLVWLPRTVTGPHVQINPTAFAISWAIAAGAWVVAQNTPSRWTH